MRSLIISILVSSVVVGSTLGANIGAVGLFADSMGTDMVIRDTGPGTLKIYVVVMYSPGVTAVQFSAPLPDCWTGATWLSDTSIYPFFVIGDSQSGIGIALGSCVPSPVHVLTINVFTSGLIDTSCCFYPVIADPNAASGEIELTDCQSNIVLGTGMTSFVGEFGPPWVGAPYPPDGAKEQPLDTELSWSIQRCSIGLGVVWSDVYFGTTPDPPMVVQYFDYSSYDPGPLAPTSTYYWKVRVVDTDGGTTVSPIWTFTTGIDVPVEVTTWGKVKALYLHNN